MATTIITIPSQGRTSQKEEEYKPHKTTKKEEQPVGGGYIKWNQLVLPPACCRLFFVFRAAAESRRRALGATLCTGQDHSASTAFSHWFIGNGQRDKARGCRAKLNSPTPVVRLPFHLSAQHEEVSLGIGVRLERKKEKKKLPKIWTQS